MTRRRPFSELKKRVMDDPVGAEHVHQYQEAMRAALALGKIRTDRGMTQKQLAESLEVSQANVSRIEHAEDLFLSSLRNYVEALGGELRVTAVFPDQEIVIAPLSEETADEDEEVKAVNEAR